MVLPKFKGFIQINNLEQYYTKLREDNDHSENVKEDHTIYSNKANNQYYCIKSITKNQGNTLSRNEVKQIEDQIRIMQNGNAGICDVYEALESSTGYHIVEEYFEGGNLEEKRINIGGYFDEIRSSEII